MKYEDFKNLKAGDYLKGIDYDFGDEENIIRHFKIKGAYGRDRQLEFDVETIWYGEKTNDFGIMFSDGLIITSDDMEDYGISDAKTYNETIGKFIEALVKSSIVL